MVIAVVVSFACAFIVAMWMKEPDVARMKLILVGAAVFSVIFVLAFFVGYSRYLSGSNFRYRKEADPNRSKSQIEQDERDDRFEEMKEDNRWRQNEERADHDREHGH